MPDDSTLQYLYVLLDEAQTLSGQFTGGYSHRFLSAEEFHHALSGSIAKLKAGDATQIHHLWLWFAPSCDWDDFTHKAGVELANTIFPLLSARRNELNAPL